MFAQEFLTSETIGPNWAQIVRYARAVKTGDLIRKYSLQLNPT